MFKALQRKVNRMMSDNAPKIGKVKPAEIVDFRSGSIPDWIREVIDVQLAIDREDAQQAGALGFMARALVIATMPYKDPKTDAFVRQNGDFKLRIVAGYEGGVPFGIYPRLLMSWVATEAVKRQSPVIELGDSLRLFMRDVLDVRTATGGKRGSGTLVTEQMKRLFGSLITAHYTGTQGKRGFLLKGVQIAEELELSQDYLDSFEALDEGKLWVPQKKDEAGTWQSTVRLSNSFFKECVSNPVPIDLRAYKALRGSPLAMDIYTWLTYRLSYTQRRTKPIRWESLMMQFGSSYSTTNPEQGVRDFRKAFLKALKAVLIVYPDAKVEVDINGLVLLPSRPHVLPAKPQQDLF
jgi:hypothetical protein